MARYGGAPAPRCGVIRSRRGWCLPAAFEVLHSLVQPRCSGAHWRPCGVPRPGHPRAPTVWLPVWWSPGGDQGVPGRRLQSYVRISNLSPCAPIRSLGRGARGSPGQPCGARCGHRAKFGVGAFSTVHIVTLALQRSARVRLPIARGGHPGPGNLFGVPQGAPTLDSFRWSALVLRIEYTSRGYHSFTEFLDNSLRTSGGSQK